MTRLPHLAKTDGGAPYPDTLPAYLLTQATRLLDAPALRQKRLGRWEVTSWREAADTVSRLAAGLVRRGFGVNDILLLMSDPGKETLLLALAAQWAGGSALPLGNDIADVFLQKAVDALRPRFSVASRDREIDRLRTLRQDVIDLNPRALGTHPDHAVLDYRALLQDTPDGIASRAQPDGTAFVFLRVDPIANVVEQRHSHASLIREARNVAASEKLDIADEALAARAFAAPAHARYLVVPWLLVGFRLNFPETSDTRERDRRDLAPTLIAGTRETYTRLVDTVASRMPDPPAWRNRALFASGDATSGPGRLLAWWLVKRPLRKVLGLARARHALLTGEPLGEDAHAFFKALDIDIRPWPDSPEWNPVARPTPYPSAAPLRFLDIQDADAQLQS